jgi:hypothetical protein
MSGRTETLERFGGEEEALITATTPSSDEARETIAVESDKAPQAPTTPQHYIAGLVLIAFLVLGAIAVGNRLLMPWSHMSSYKEYIAQTLLSGQNVGVFDLNVDIRGIRRAQFAAMKNVPEVMLLGASQWQEVPADVLPGHEMFNAHVHRDYYDDVVAAVGLLLKYDVMPRRLIISVRDSTFTSVSSRTDALWVNFISEYQDAEKQLGIPPRPWWENVRPKDIWSLFSLGTAVDMSRQWMRSLESPGARFTDLSETLDILMSDGSIRWSNEHRRLFTPKRAKQLSVAMAQSIRNRAPEIDPVGVAAFSAALARLQAEGVDVILVHPPFNPDFYDRITDTVYSRGLAKVVALTKELAETYNFKTAGSMDPSVLGCTSSMFIDAEHSGPNCMGRILTQAAARFAP